MYFLLILVFYSDEQWNPQVKPLASIAVRYFELLYQSRMLHAISDGDKCLM